MKKALPTFAAALAIFLYAFGSADPKVVEPRPRLDLDFSGVDTLEIDVLGSSEIELSDRIPPGLSDSWSPGEAPRIERVGSRLRISDQAERKYRRYELKVPTTVRRFIVNGADFTAHTPLAAIEIDTTDDASWAGDVGTLRIRDFSKPRPQCGCGATVSVNRGKIGQLRIESMIGSAEINDIDAVTEATLVLGPKARFSVGGRRGLGALRLVDMPGAGSVEAEPKDAKVEGARTN